MLKLRQLFLGCSLSSALHLAPACWDRFFRDEADVFHLHIPRTAGCSLVEDLSQMVGRENIYSHEVCASFASTRRFKATVAMFRRPREHVFSMYHFCAASTDPVYRRYIGAVKRGANGQNYHLAGSFSQWVDEWVTHPRWGDYQMYQDYESCYCPYNLQSSRLACNSPRYARYCHAEVDVTKAMSSLQNINVIGLKEAYRESTCLMHAHLLQTLPQHCNCESSSWLSHTDAELDHGLKYHASIDEMPMDTREKVDNITAIDHKIYSAALQRFIQDIHKAEQRFGVKILCAERKAKLYKGLERF